MPGGLQHLLAYEGVQMRFDRPAQIAAAELCQGVGGEFLADDACTLHKRALLVIEAIEARCDESVDGRWDRYRSLITRICPGDIVGVFQRAHHLFDVKRVAFCGLFDRGDQGARQCSAEHGLYESACVFICESFETECLRAGDRASPVWARVEQVGARRTEQKHRCGLDGSSEVFEEV